MICDILPHKHILKWATSSLIVAEVNYSWLHKTFSEVSKVCGLFLQKLCFEFLGRYNSNTNQAGDITPTVLY